jgi:acetolactate synthase-1/2/3 large subunit
VSRSTVADVVVDGLKRAGTPRLIGVVGGSHPLLDSARAGDLPVTLVSGEKAAGIMAAVTGDLVEAPGAVLIPSGRGILSVVDGLAQALVDRAALIVLTDLHSGELVEGKASLRVTTESASHRIAHATRLAATHPRGPVHLEIPAELARQPTVPVATSCRPDPLPQPNPAMLDGAAKLLARAARPLLIAGMHCRSAGVQPWVRALTEALPAPTIVTSRAKGALPDPHPLMLGVLGADGVDAGLLKRADLVVALGLDALELGSASWWSTVSVLAVGPPQALGERVPAIELVGDVAVLLEELAPRLRDRERADWDVAELDRHKRELAAGPAAAEVRARRRIVRVAREATPAGTIATVDAGPHQVDVAVAWHAVAPRELLISNGPATDGFALSAAIGTHLVHPDRRVLCFTGADGLTASVNELETAMRLGAKIVVIAFDGSASDALTQLGESRRITTFAADGDAHFARALGRALEAAGPSLIAVRS